MSTLEELPEQLQRDVSRVVAPSRWVLRSEKTVPPSEWSLDRVARVVSVRVPFAASELPVMERIGVEWMWIVARVNVDSLFYSIEIESTESVGVELQELFRRMMAAKIQTYPSGIACLYEMLRWADKQFLSLFDLAEEAKATGALRAVAAAELRSAQTIEWTQAQQRQLESALKKYPPRKGIDARARWDLIAKCIEGKNAKQCIARFKELRKALKAQQIEALVDEKEEKSHQTIEKESDDFEISGLPGVNVSLEEVEFKGIAIVRVAVLRLQLCCMRCSSAEDVDLRPSQLAALICRKCNLDFAAKFKLELAHADKLVIGRIELDSCVALDYRASDFWVNCFSCMEDYLFCSLQLGKAESSHCRSCHAALAITFQRVIFSDQGRASSSLLPAGKGISSLTKVTGLGKPLKPSGGRKFKPFIVGNPLPDNGTCKHYRKSYRWLRFPCCSKAYPCDICHDECSDHEMKIATRTICGFCSREYPIRSSQPECECGKSRCLCNAAHRKKTKWDPYRTDRKSD